MIDKDRPCYHFLPPANWLNDPNGVCQWRGEYHLFYQYNPLAAEWGLIHWGHAVSTDLVHWEHLPLAFSPTPGGPDTDGCWSGCFINNDGVPTLIYTGVHGGEQRPCLATSDDDLRTWRKYPANPLITDTPPGLELAGFRDHCIWREGETWYQIIGTGFVSGGGAILLYLSRDLVEWHYEQPFCVDEAGTPGELWECPDFFTIEEKQILLISSIVSQETTYRIGSYVAHSFETEAEDVLDAGGCLYAPQTFMDEQGRRIVWGWLREAQSKEAQLAAGWSGTMTLPLVATLSSDKRLQLSPAPEVFQLRRDHRSYTDLAVAPGVPHVLDLAGDCAEIEVTFAANTAADFGLLVRATPDGDEYTRIGYNRADQQLYLDRRHSSLRDDVLKDTRGHHQLLSTDESLTLHIFVDRSTIEVFTPAGTYHAARVYPTDDAKAIGLYCEGGAVSVTQLDVWQLKL